MNPESHLRYDRERHADLLREARESELAAKLVKAPRSPSKPPGVRHMAYTVRGPAQPRPRVGRAAHPLARRRVRFLACIVLDAGTRRRRGLG